MDKKILKLNPAFKDYIWGGTNLKTKFNKKTDLPTVAESWELSCHSNGTNTIYPTDESLNEYLQKNPHLLGTNAKHFENFPILIKLIDAKDNLSIQVHPSNEYAMKRHNSYGKTEFWYVVDCAPDSYLYYGFKDKISKDEFVKRIENNTLTDVLNKVNIKKGDTFFIKAGTVHAICKNTMIAEIQQNSDITYRIYDYNRKDKNGNTRELHIDSAIDVTSFEMPNNPKPKVLIHNDDYTLTHIARSEYFYVNKYELKKACEIFVDNSSFMSFLVLDGEGKINYENGTLEYKKGDSLFIPAGFGSINITGTSEFLTTQIP
ncbi:MAG: class I mannose-6-phosphate isomerase [Clostridia bacterium]|nr:class I mannose-6-phosphate isomerase [Clostridia bacterium]